VNQTAVTNPGTFGPAYEQEHDADRLNTQMLCIRDAMLAHSRCGRWRTLGEIRSELEGQLHRRFPEASISAQLRHLRKREFGSFRLLKQRRSSRTLGLFEYQLLPPDPMNAQPELFETVPLAKASQSPDWYAATGRNRA
jgi:hypothetical protein